MPSSPAETVGGGGGARNVQRVGGEGRRRARNTRAIEPVTSVGAGKAPAKESAQLAELQRQGRGGLRTAALKFLDLAYHDKAGANKSTPVRWWRKFCQYGVGEGALRVLDVTAPLQTKLGEELLIMEYACWLVQVRGGRCGSSQCVR